MNLRFYIYVSREEDIKEVIYKSRMVLGPGHDSLPSRPSRSVCSKTGVPEIITPLPPPLLLFPNISHDSFVYLVSVPFQ